MIGDVQNLLNQNRISQYLDYPTFWLSWADAMGYPMDPSLNPILLIQRTDIFKSASIAEILEMLNNQSDIHIDLVSKDNLLNSLRGKNSQFQYGLFDDKTLRTLLLAAGGMYSAHYFDPTEVAKVIMGNLLPSFEVDKEGVKNFKALESVLKVLAQQHLALEAVYLLYRLQLASETFSIQPVRFTYYMPKKESLICSKLFR